MSYPTPSLEQTFIMACFVPKSVFGLAKNWRFSRLGEIKIITHKERTVQQYIGICLDKSITYLLAKDSKLKSPRGNYKGTFALLCKLSWIVT